MGALVVLLTYPGNQFRVHCEDFFDVCGRGNNDEVGSLNLLDAAMGLDMDIVHGLDGFSVCGGDGYIKKRCLGGFI